MVKEGTVANTGMGDLLITNKSRDEEIEAVTNLGGGDTAARGQGGHGPPNPVLHAEEVQSPDRAGGSFAGLGGAWPFAAVSHSLQDACTTLCRSLPRTDAGKNSSLKKSRRALPRE